jgi:hypothetical protein
VFAVVGASVGAGAFDRLFYPFVEVAAEPVRITVTNCGSAPANNLVLSITFPKSNFTAL